jgi:hypothetical protein
MLLGRKPAKADPLADEPTAAQIEDEPTAAQIEDEPDNRVCIIIPEDESDEIVEARRKDFQTKANVSVGCRPWMERLRKEFEILDRRDYVNAQLNFKMALAFGRYASEERWLNKHKERYDAILAAHGARGSPEENHARDLYEDTLIEFKEAAADLEKQHAECSRTREMANTIC